MHDHPSLFHGYYCINAEPSKTHYEVDKNTIYDIININNNIILSKTGIPHSKGDWQEEEKRITIAYDIIGTNDIDENEHWLRML